MNLYLSVPFNWLFSDCVAKWLMSALLLLTAEITAVLFEFKSGPRQCYWCIERPDQCFNKVILVEKIFLWIVFLLLCVCVGVCTVYRWDILGVKLRWINCSVLLTDITKQQNLPSPSSSWMFLFYFFYINWKDILPLHSASKTDQTIHLNLHASQEGDNLNSHWKLSQDHAEGSTQNQTRFINELFLGTAWGSDDGLTLTVIRYWVLSSVPIGLHKPFSWCLIQK